MTRLLLSVSSLEEASMAARCGVDVIDLKDPSRGALGALRPECIRTILAQLPDWTFSATCGDRPFTPDIALVVRALAEIGVDFIKIGLFPPLRLEETLSTLAEVAKEHRLIAVLLADLFEGDLEELLDQIKEAGFWGAMLDVAAKHRGSLPEIWTFEEIERFVELCHRLHLGCGLAGGLSFDHIQRLLPLGPNYLGFRSAACEGDRTGSLCWKRVVRLREQIPPA